MIGYIYKVTNTITGKSYIGQTTRSVKWRWLYHQYEAQKELTYKSHFKSSIAQYGADAFQVETLATVESDSTQALKQKLDEWEKYYIDNLNTYGSNGYNSTIGGDGTLGAKLSDFTRQRISEAVKRRVIKQETKDRISDNRSKYKVDVYRLDGSYIKTFEKVKDIVNEFDIRATTIQACCRGERKQAYGYIWRYQGSALEVKAMELPHSRFSKSVLQYDTLGNLIGSYKSATSAGRTLNIATSSITQCCLGRLNSAGGYVWKFKEQGENKWILLIN